jgi:hypothetical protein
MRVVFYWVIFFDWKLPGRRLYFLLPRDVTAIAKVRGEYQSQAKSQSLHHVAVNEQLKSGESAPRQNWRFFSLGGFDA